MDGLKKRIWNIKCNRRANLNWRLIMNMGITVLNSDSRSCVTMGIEVDMEKILCNKKEKNHEKGNQYKKYFDHEPPIGGYAIEHLTSKFKVRCYFLIYLWKGDTVEESLAHGAGGGAVDELAAVDRDGQTEEVASKVKWTNMMVKAGGLESPKLQKPLRVCGRSKYYMRMCADVFVVLPFVEEEGGSMTNRRQVSEILEYFTSYEFVFYLYMMYDNSIVRGTVETLKSLRNTGFDRILPNVSSFCQKQNIDTLDMEDLYVGATSRKTLKTKMLFDSQNVAEKIGIATRKRMPVHKGFRVCSAKLAASWWLRELESFFPEFHSFSANQTRSNRFQFEVEIFNTVVDMQLNEYGDRFSETNTQLLEYMGALCRCDSFAQFDQSKLLNLSKLYNLRYFITLERNFRPFPFDGEYGETSVLSFGLLAFKADFDFTHSDYNSTNTEICFSKIKLLKTDLLVKVEIENVMESFQKMDIRRFQI
ncbi:hypothetical protein LXL04_028008 [Taraxacum kok-saghyz]